MADHESVDSRNGIQETGANLDRESGVSTLFGSQSRGKRDIEKPKLEHGEAPISLIWKMGTHLIDPEDGEFQETIQNARTFGSSCGSGYALHYGDKKACLEVTGNCGECMLVSWKLTSPQGSVWNLLFQDIMKITSVKKDSIQ